MNLQEEFNTFTGNNSWAEFSNLLSSFGLVDLGIIEELDGKIAYVQTFTLRGLEWRRVQCEILMIGNMEGCLGEVTPGQLVLIIIPRSPVSDAELRTVNPGAGRYSTECAKCIPLGVYNPSQDVMLSVMGGDLCIATSEYTKTYSLNSIRMLAEKISMQLDLASGEASLDWGSGVGCVEIHDDGALEIGSGYTYDVQNKKFNWKSHVSQLPDGSIVIEGAGLVNDSTHESFGKNKLVLDTSGNITIQAGLDKNGQAQAEIKVNADGTIAITNKAAYTISGVGVTIDGTSGKVCIKNTKANLYTDVLLSILNKFNQGAVTTAGSPGSHNVTPSQFTQEAQALNDLME